MITLIINYQNLSKVLQIPFQILHFSNLILSQSFSFMTQLILTFSATYPLILEAFLIFLQLKRAPAGALIHIFFYEEIILFERLSENCKE